MDKNSFEIEFHSEEEVQEMLDATILAIGSAIETDEQRAGLLNPMKMQQMQFAYGVLKYLTKNSGSKITYELNAPFKSMGSISVEGTCLKFTNTEWFSRAAEFASNTEIYPLANGKVRMTLTFHGLVRPLK